MSDEHKTSATRYTFIGEPSGDCACFCFDVLNSRKKKTRLYPDDIMAALGCAHGKRYRFTITAEEVK